MPKAKSSKRFKNRSKVVKYAPTIRELAPSVLEYKGRIGTPGTLSAKELHTVQLDSTFAITSSGSGVINTVISNDPSSGTSWSDWAALYQNYRTLGFSISYAPFNQYNRVSTTVAPLVTVLDRDSNFTALVSYDNASQFNSMKFADLSHRWSRSIQMAGSQDGVFSPTGSLTTTYFIKLFSTGNSFSTTYGQLFVRYLVQFQGIGT
jgi:hypothetical protein